MKQLQVAILLLAVLCWSFPAQLFAQGHVIGIQSVIAKKKASAGGDLFTDTFSYSDGGLDGNGSWTEQVNDIDVTSNIAHAANLGGNFCVASHSGTLDDDQYSWVEIDLGSGGHSQVGAAVRFSTSDSNAGYAIQWSDSTDTVSLITFQGSSTVTEASVASTTYSDGDKIAISVTGTGTGIRITGYADTGSGFSAIGSLTSIDPTGTLEVESGDAGVVGQLSNTPASAAVGATSWGSGNGTP